MSSWPVGTPAVAIGETGAFASFTGASEGDARRCAVEAGWHWVRQVHGSHVVVVSAGDAPGEQGDALVSRVGVRLAVLVADCAPVMLASPEGVIGAVHCGWRGLVAGVADAAAAAMRSMGATRIEAALGPCIGPECYAFGEEDLVRVEEAFGPDSTTLRARTIDGRTALDLRKGVRAALESTSVSIAYEDRRCTACDDGLFSARARKDVARQAGLVWRGMA